MTTSPYSTHDTKHRTSCASAPYVFLWLALFTELSVQIKFNSIKTITRN